MSDAQALAALATQGKSLSDFGRDLLTKHNERGLSEQQFVWVHILTNQKPRGFIPDDAPSFVKIVAHMHTALAQLKSPKVRLEIDEANELQLNVAGDKAKFPRSINMTDGMPYGESTFYGRIHTDGRAELRDGSEVIIDTLKAFDADPIDVAKATGKRTGRCCFCGKDLTTPESRSAGYGKTCANNFDMPWGQVDDVIVNGDDKSMTDETNARADDIKLSGETTDPIELSGRMIQSDDEHDSDDVPF